MQKYYFIFYRCDYVSWPKTGTPSSGRIESQQFVDIHPIKWQIEANNEYGSEHKTTGGGTKRENYLVMNWQEVTKDEHDEFKGWVG